MDNKEQFDFWYAVNNTELISAPTSRLETFGDTIVNYYMVSELMDTINKVRVREGRLKAFKPEIITPGAMRKMNLDDFGPEARMYAEWLEENGGDLRILQYGFKIQKQELKEYIVSDCLDKVVDVVRSEVEAKQDPLSAILVGVDDPWEVSLLKLMVELVQHSANGNMHEIQALAAASEESLTYRIDQAFMEAARDRSQIHNLADILKSNDLWDQYQDRFFALVRSAQD